MSLHTEGDEYAMQAYAVEIDPGFLYGSILVVLRMPSGAEIHRDASVLQGGCYRDAREAVRQALARGRFIIRAEQRRRKTLI
jgi:hypothetical protein